MSSVHGGEGKKENGWILAHHLNGGLIFKWWANI
jgi:hypothetical protein